MSERAEGVFGNGTRGFAAAQERDGAEGGVDGVGRVLRFQTDAVARRVCAAEERARVKLEGGAVGAGGERDAGRVAAQLGEGAQAAVEAVDVEAVVVIAADGTGFGKNRTACRPCGRARGQRQSSPTGRWRPTRKAAGGGGRLFRVRPTG